MLSVQFGAVHCGTGVWRYWGKFLEFDLPVNLFDLLFDGLSLPPGNTCFQRPGSTLNSILGLGRADLASLNALDRAWLA